MTCTSVVTELFSKFETEAVAVCIKILFLLVENLFEVESRSGVEEALWEFWHCQFCRVCGLFFGLEKYKLKCGDVHYICYICNFVYKNSLHEISQSKWNNVRCFSKTIFVHVDQLFWHICFQNDFRHKTYIFSKNF